MKEIIFEVREDESDGGFVAHALGEAIHTQGDTLEGLKAAIRDAIECHFDSDADKPRIVHLHLVRDEVMTL